MDGSVEVSIQMFNWVMSGRDSSETGMIEGMKVRHVVLKFKVNGGTDKWRPKEGKDWGANKGNYHI